MRHAALALWLLPLVVLVAGCGDAGGPADTPPTDQGTPTAEGPAVEPTVSTLSLDGVMDLVEDTERGKPIVLNLMATWCAPCVTELPAIAALAEHAGDKASVVLLSFDYAINEKGHASLDDAVAAVRALAVEKKIACPIYVLDPTEQGGVEFFSLFEVENVVPHTVLFDKDGEKVGHHAEFPDAATAKAWFDEQMK
jgi:thiol-disulfide isomerase/thioredoxin